MRWFDKECGGRCACRARVKKALGLVIWVLVHPPAQAMDLREAYEAAHANDASIRASRAASDASRERLPQALSQRLPNVSFSASRNYNDLTSKSQDMFGRPLSLRNHYYSDNQSLTVRQPLYRPFVSASVEQARAQLLEAETTQERDEQSLVVRVGEAYFDALLAREQLDLIAAQKSSYAVQLDAARKALVAGTGTRTDVDEAQARVDLTRAQELEIFQNLDFTQRRLEVLTGISGQELASLETHRFLPEQLIPDQVQSWVEQAEQASPELQALSAQAEVARLEIDKAQAGHKPTLDAVAQWARTNSDSVTSVNSRYDQRLIGLQLSVPLYGGGYVSSTVRQAVALHERARETLEAARRDLGVRVHKEFRAVTEGVLRIEALEQAVRSAEQAVLSNSKSREAGVRTTLDVLNAEQQKTVALRDLAQARYLYLLSRLRLQALAGKDRWESIAQANAWLVH